MCSSNRPWLHSRGYSRSEITAIIERKRASIAHELSTHKQASVRSQMMGLFSSQVSLHSSSCGRLIDDFMQGDINPLADALCAHEKTNAQREISKQFPNSTISDIASALDNPSQTVVMRIATEESHRQLKEQQVVKNKLETGFVKINLGANDKPVDLEGTCFWVPASVRHDIKKDDTTGLARYSFFVYGGVSVQPRINVVAGGNAALDGRVIAGGSIQSVNAQAAMNHKLSALQTAQTKAVRTEQFPDGRVRYYTAERQSKTFGSTRGNSIVTEYNTKTGQVRMWAESYDHTGKVSRVHPKMIDGKNVKSYHYPPTGAEMNKLRGPK